MSDLRAGYGERIITPPLGRGMTGYGCYLDRNAESVLDDLKVRAVSLRRGGERLLLVNCDLIGLTVEFSDAARAEIAAAQGMSRAGVFLACIHTHSGPASQHLIGMPEAEPEYLEQVRQAIVGAAAEAAADEAPAEFSYFLEAIEPIGFNRRNRSFEPIDPVLKVAVLERSDGKLYLLNYSCHAVTLGVNQAWSADWPGGVVAEIEADGHRGIVFQGFLGDINPTANGLANVPDKAAFLPYYGRLIYDRTRMAEARAEREQAPALRAVERRIDLPLAVPTEEGLEEDYRRWRERFAGNEGFERAIDEWHARAQEALARYTEDPYMRDVPLQAAGIGGLRLVGFPGETFCEYGMRLRVRHPALMVFGHCGGNVGYLPMRSAYETEGDYACYLASKLYGLYPFAPGIEETLLREAEGALGETG
jgi:hypothetical protein